MCTFKSFSVITACVAIVAIVALPLTAIAQQGAAITMPPRLEKLEEAEAPAATVRNPETGARITEKRERGQVTSIRVESGNSTYYVKPNSPVSSAFGSDAQNSTTRAAQWQILQFDWNRDREKTREAAAQAATIAPPPALPPSKNQ
jgi:hypothetical protein